MDPCRTTAVAQSAGPGVWVLGLAGELTGAAEGPVMDALAEALRGEPAAIVLDLRGLEGMDGSGLGLLVKLSFWAVRKETRLLAFGLSPRCRLLFEELGLGSVISLHASREKALRAAGLPHAAPSEEDAGLGAKPDLDACPATQWAGPMGRAHLGAEAAGGAGLNVEGHRVRGPFDGFGQLWQKTYTVRLSGAQVSPAEVVRLCSERLGELWPQGSRLHIPPPGLVPGAVGMIELRLPGGLPLKTGMRVLHASAESFTFVTLSGHMEAGFITFGAREEEGVTVVRVESTARTGDPLYEVGFVLFGHSQQEAFWRSTLEALARHYGVPASVQVSKTCLDGSRQWAGAKNVVFNAAARTGLFMGLSLLSRVLRPAKR